MKTTQLFLDCEVYRNYFLAMFMNEAGNTRSFECFGDDPMPVKQIEEILYAEGIEFVTFNGIGYDLPILQLVQLGNRPAKLKQASDDIIHNQLFSWEFYKKYSVTEPTVNHLDLMGLPIGQVGLKLYGGRLHSKKLQDLPFDPHLMLTREQANIVKRYCRNDLLLTRDLRDNLSKQIELRRVMGEEYNIDLRSKSDAQIAEAVLKAEYFRLSGVTPKKVPYRQASFKFVPPDYVKFTTPELQRALDVIVAAEFIVKETGHVEMPEAISGLVLTINGRTYQMGIGGLHSQESEVSHYADSSTQLFDIDVASYYPSLMLNMGMEPLALQGYFREIYKGILNKRLTAKRNGDKVTDACLKIVLNGTFGKTSSMYSILYNPEFMVRTTLSGQLSLLMLIEKLEQLNIPVVSANTDGVVVKCDVNKKRWLEEAVISWQDITNLQTEWNEYASLHSRDVNNYIAVKTDRSVKVKGTYRVGDIGKNPQNEISSLAVITYLQTGVPCATTIRECSDIRKFLTLRTVTGGAEKDGAYLGKAIRWYYSITTSGTIKYFKNGNDVPRSEGGRPVMELPETLPDDINYAWYEEESRHLLFDLGVVARPQAEPMPRKNSKAWKALLEESKVKLGHKGDWEWVL